jgi:hypothetical protein
MSKQSDLLNLTDAISVSGTNVGIGTTSPSNFSGYTTLDVVNATNGGAILTRGSTVEARIVADQPTGVVQVKAQSNHPLTFGTSGTERMRIDTAGRVTMPYQPAFLAIPTGGQYNFPINAQTTVDFANEIFDQGNNFSGSTTFTAPVSGRYQFSVMLYANNMDTATDYYQCILETSNRTYPQIVSSNRYTADLTYFSFAVSILVDMDAGDTASVKIDVPNSGTAQLDLESTASRFSGYLVA